MSGMELGVLPDPVCSDLSDVLSRQSEGPSDIGVAAGCCTDSAHDLGREEGGATSADVLGARDSFEVAGTDTVADRAEMVDVESHRDRPDLLLVHRTMCESAASLELHAAIAVGLRCAVPDPARRRVAVIANRPKLGGQALPPLRVADMASNEPHRLPSDMPELPVRHPGNRGWLTTAAFTELHPRDSNEGGG